MPVSFSLAYLYDFLRMHACFIDFLVIRCCVFSSPIFVSLSVYYFGDRLHCMLHPPGPVPKHARIMLPEWDEEHDDARREMGNEKGRGPAARPSLQQRSTMECLHMYQ